MSETAQRTNARLDNFEANKAAHEQARYEDSMYGEAGKTDFSDEAKNRLQEADTYEQHLESLAARDDGYDEVAANLENGDYKDAIDRQIASNPQLRRMEAMAKAIATTYATEVTPENSDRLPTIVKDKEDKLQELLIAFNDTSDLDQADKDEITKRIIDMSDQSVASEAPITPDVEADTDSEPTLEETPDAESSDSRPPEGNPALEGESPEEYERRNNVNPALAIDPNEISIAVPEMPTDNPENNAEHEFAIGDNVRVRRSSGEVDDGWEVIDISANDSTGMVLVGKESVGTKRIPWQELVDMQSLEVTSGELSEDDDQESQPDIAEETDSDDVEATSETEDTPEDETGAEGRARNWFKRAKDVVNGGLTKLYFGVGRTMNKLASNQRKEGETDDEYNERMQRNGRRAAIGITAVAVAYGAYRLYHGIDSGSGNGGAGSSGGTGTEHPFNPSVDPSDLGPDTNNGGNPAPNNELLNSSAWNIPKGSGGEALMDRLGIDKSVWYEHQSEFLDRFPSDAYRMSDGNVGFDYPGRLSNGAIEYWSQFAGK